MPAKHTSLLSSSSLPQNLISIDALAKIWLMRRIYITGRGVRETIGYAQPVKKATLTEWLFGKNLLVLRSG
jgi:hypothetical protein